MTKGLHLLSPAQASAENVWLDRGTKPQEARKRGCSFDILSFAWQTPECYDHANSEAFQKHNGTWSYFADSDGTRQMSEETAMAGQTTAFVMEDFHFTYMWRQLHRAYTVLGYVDSHLDNWNHTLRCQKVLLRSQSVDKQRISTADRVIYPRCKKIVSSGL